MPEKTIVVMHPVLDIRAPVNSLHLDMWLLKVSLVKSCLVLDFKSLRDDQSDIPVQVGIL